MKRRVEVEWMSEEESGGSRKTFTQKLYLSHKDLNTQTIKNYL